LTFNSILEYIVTPMTDIPPQVHAVHAVPEPATNDTAPPESAAALGEVARLDALIERMARVYAAKAYRRGDCTSDDLCEYGFDRHDVRKYWGEIVDRHHQHLDTLNQENR